MLHAVVDSDVDASYSGDKSDFETWLLSEETSHAAKLDLLADLVTGFSGSIDDLLVFIDSDAVPLPGWETEVRRLLEKYDVVAMERHEFGGDDFSHPAFCVISVRNWLTVGGRWADRSSWRNSNGTFVTKVGGGLTNKFCEHNLARAALVRSNRLEIFPPFFAVYGDVVYHHTAGSYPKQAHRNVAQVSDFDALALRATRLIVWAMKRAVATRPWANLYAVDSYVRTSISVNPGWPLGLVGRENFAKVRISFEVLLALITKVFLARFIKGVLAVRARSHR